MELEFMNFITNITLESVFLSLLVLTLTMIIKKPIKKSTKKLNDKKRQALNTIILAIPLGLSFVLSTFWYGLINKEYSTLNITEATINSWILSLVLYEFIDRIKKIVKSINLTNCSKKNVSETVKETKKIIKELNKKLKDDQKSLTKIINRKKILNETKRLLELSNDIIDLTKLSQTNIEIQSLDYKEQKIRQTIDSVLNQIKLSSNDG